MNAIARRPQEYRPPRQAGFTLTELIVTMSIVAILLGIGVPSYRYVTTANRVSTEINGLLGDLRLARSEAVKEGQPVTVCPTTDQISCAGAGTVDWTTGWLVLANLNGTITILRQQQGFRSGDTLTSDNNAVASVVFNREGFAPGLTKDTTFTVRDSTLNASYTRCLQIKAVGMMATMTPVTDTTGTCNT